MPQKLVIHIFRREYDQTTHDQTLHGLTCDHTLTAVSPTKSHGPRLSLLRGANDTLLLLVAMIVLIAYDFRIAERNAKWMLAFAKFSIHCLISQFILSYYKIRLSSLERRSEAKAYIQGY
ncbi:hypothetical protein L1887_06418 [Cichorium endivia]|nr:hypothetical protein L1887_06418 [Cichorium endivia]